MTVKKIYWQPTNVLSYDAYINYLIGSRGVVKGLIVHEE